MDPKELKKIERMAENISLSDNDVKKMQISMHIDFGNDLQNNPDKIKSLAEQEKIKQENEISELLEKMQNKPENIKQKVLSELKEKNTTSTPFEMSSKTEMHIQKEREENKKIAEEKEAAKITKVEKVDSKVALRISDDNMHAFISLTPATGGGRVPSAPMIESYLLKKGITYGIDKKKIQQIIKTIKENKNVTDFEISTGKEIEEGQDCKINITFEEATASDFLGNINDENTICIGGVKKNDILLKIKPAVPGRSGYTVTGEELKAKDVKRLQIETKRNTKKAGDTIISEIDGIVYYYEDSIVVKPYADSVIDIKIPEDKMSATMDLKPAVGDGLKLTKKAVLKSLANRKIKFGINEKSIEDAVEKCESETIQLQNIPVAKGEQPVNGIDSKIIFKVQLEATHKLKSSSKGNVDFREKDSIINVPKETLVAVYFPPQKKIKNGSDIHGTVIPGNDGTNIEIKLGKNIETKQLENGNIEYYAKIDGQVVFDNQKLDMEPLFIVPKDLDLDIGNIDFLGNVQIKGNVGDNFTVKAGGDIEIAGNVGSSHIEAGRNIYVKGGIITKEAGSIKAGADVNALFAENANIIAKKNINIERAVLNSKIAACDSIICKKGKGQIIGGHIIVKNKLEVNELGNQAGTKTEVTVGIDYFELEHQSIINSEQQKFSQALEKIQAILAKFDKYTKETGQELTEEIKKSKVDLMQKEVLVQKKLHEIKMEKIKLSLHEENREITGDIIVYKTINTDVIITMDKHSIKTNQAKDKQHIFLDKKTDKIEFEPYIQKKNE